jgi:hypothetical protein
MTQYAVCGMQYEGTIFSYFLYSFLGLQIHISSFPRGIFRVLGCSVGFFLFWDNKKLEYLGLLGCFLLVWFFLVFYLVFFSFLLAWCFYRFRGLVIFSV